MEVKRNLTVKEYGLRRGSVGSWTRFADLKLIHVHAEIFFSCSATGSLQRNWRGQPPGRSGWSCWRS
jgi:hypothetical protein